MTADASVDTTTEFLEARGEPGECAALPPVLADIPGLSFSSLYEPASHEAQTGGDFYDAFRLLDGRIVMAIGDITGAGPAAAATTDALRQNIRAVASVNPDPRTLLKAADDVFIDAGGPPFASVFVAIIDPLTLSLQYANAGHPPPILRRPDGSVQMLKSNDLLLGAVPRTEQGAREVSRMLVEPGSLLVLYTGEMTKNTQDAPAGARRLEEAVVRIGALDGKPADLAREIYAAAFDGCRGAHDDIAVMALRLDERLGDCKCGAVSRWHFDVSDGNAARHVRCEVIDALNRHGCGEEAIFSAEMVFSELVGNVFRYVGTPVDALELTQTLPVLHVLDSGDGFSLNPKLPADAYAERGRGLYIVMQLTRDFTVTPRTITAGSHARAVLNKCA